MKIAATMTPHTLVVCIDKQERGVAIQAVLSKAGYRVFLAVSLYDALKLISQEMPHLVITEALLSDGTAGTIFDRLEQHPVLHKTPILVHILKKTKDELGAVAGRKFAGFFLGAFEPRGFLNKVHEIVLSHAAVSPYFVDTQACGLAGDMTISIEANAVGRSGENLVLRSNAEIDPALSMLCVPQSSELAPVVLRMASNLRQGDEIFNLFPIHRMVGAGRKWVLGLSELKLGAGGDRKQALRKVLFFDPSEERFAEFRDILSGYDMELIHAPSLALLVAMLKSDGESIAACYLHELLNDASSMEWRLAYSKLPANKRPPLIVGTSSAGARSQAGMSYIKRPFGLGLLVEMLQTAFESGDELAQVVGKAGSVQTAGLPVRFLVPASLVGLDETGGIMQLSFPLFKGSRLSIQHPFLVTAWEGNTVVQVVGAAADAELPDVWYVRFEAVSVGSSKVKYWEKIAKSLAAFDAKHAANDPLEVSDPKKSA